jgi:hypothetical protein
VLYTPTIGVLMTSACCLLTIVPAIYAWLIPFFRSLEERAEEQRREKERLSWRAQEVQNVIFIRFFHDGVPF